MTDFFMYQYGSTEQQLNRRLYSYKSNNLPCVNYFNDIGWDKVYIILLEEGQFENTQALRKREGEIIAYHINKEYCLNKRVAGRTPSESCKAYQISHSNEIKIRRLAVNHIKTIKQRERRLLKKSIHHQKGPQS